VKVSDHEAMASTSTSLNDQLTLPCGQVLPNRFMKSALSEALGDAAQAPTESLERLFSRWGRGGYGLVVTGNVMVDRRQLGEKGNVAVEDERHLDQLTRRPRTAAPRSGCRSTTLVDSPTRLAGSLQWRRARLR
jgi:2,4-dienoyl-CoA reductase-like NADH-dependent reductase (Old Yellow Enzyme family)